MIKFVTFASDKKLSALVCSSMAVLLTACGGQAVEDSPTQSATAGFIASSEQAAAPAVAIQAQDSAITAAPQAGTAVTTEADFAMSGYNGDIQQGNTSAMQTAFAPQDDAALAPTTNTPQVTIPATTYKLYVSPSGNDSSAGTATAPFRTLARAARSTRAGTTVFVAPGTYDGGFKTTVHGTASARIYYVSTTKWGAKIVPPASSTNKVAWDNRGNYVDIIGFHVDGSAPRAGTRWASGIYNGGSYDMIRNNWVHHIAHNITCGSAGGSAIGVDSYYRGVKTDVVGNLVHDIGPAGCRYVQGIYISTSGTVKNNVVYRVAEGAIHLWHDAANVIITNNTVTASNTGIIVGGGDFYFTSGPSDNNAVYNNIVYDNKMGISEQGKTGRNNTYRNNLVFQNSTYNWKLNNGLTHTSTITSSPLFVAYSRTGTPNLKLSASSPAIGRGTSAQALAYDFLERPRNATTGYDVGAYQH